MTTQQSPLELREPVTVRNRIKHAPWQLLTWVNRRKKRLLLLTWVIVMFQIGSASLASADDLFKAPYTAGDGTATPFERYDTGDYAFLYAPDSNNDELDGLFSDGLAAVTDGLFYLGASIVRGALIAMQWMLGLDLYQDNAGQVDAAVTTIANNLMIPLMGITIVIAAFSAYARARREGGESIFNEVAWIAAGGILAVAFGLFPGTFISIADSARAEVGNMVMKTYALAQSGDDNNALGVDNGGDLTGNPQCGQAGTCSDMTALNASRHLSNSLWDAWVNTPWCVAQFRNLETCSKIDDTPELKEHAGVTNAQMLLDPERREALQNLLADQYDDISDGDKYEAWGGNDRWIRGMLGGRFGVVLVFFLVSIPMALFMLGLVLFGLMAAVGLLLLVIVGPFFLALWMIPGAPRRSGLQWLHELLSVLFQSVLIVISLGAVAVVTAIVNSNMGQYGYFMCGLLNLVVLVVAWRLRAAMQNFTGSGGGVTTSGMISSYSAWKVMGMAGRGARRLGRGTRAAAGSAGSAADLASGGGGRGPLRRPLHRSMQRSTQRLPSMSELHGRQGSGALPPRPAGREGSYANMGIPMSDGERRRERRAQARADNRVHREIARTRTGGPATSASAGTRVYPDTTRTPVAPTGPTQRRAQRELSPVDTLPVNPPPRLKAVPSPRRSSASRSRGPQLSSLPVMPQEQAPRTARPSRAPSPVTEHRRRRPRRKQ